MLSSIITPDLLTDLLRGALLPIAGAVGQSIVMVGEEWLKLWKLKNAVKVGKRAVEHLNERGITNKEQLKQLTTKFGILYLQGAAVEEEPTLQELWAKLLANALDPQRSPKEPHIAFISVLKELSVSDAKILNFFYSECKRKREAQPHQAYLYTLEREAMAPFLLRSRVSLPEEEIEMCLQNLTRLQLMEREYQKVTQYGVDEYSKTSHINLLSPTGRYKVSIFGAKFLEACF